MKIRFIDKISLPLFIIGIGILAFFCGIAAAYYHLPVYRHISDALEAKNIWLEQILSPKEKTEIAIGGDIHEALNHRILEIRDPSIKGYTLISVRYSKSMWLIDMDGNIVHEWKWPFKKEWPSPVEIHRMAKIHVGIQRARIFPNGDAIVQYEALGDTPFGYVMAKIDKDSHILWTYSEHTHHDFYVDAENGRIFTLIHALVFGPSPGLEKLVYPLLADSVAILSPDGKELKKIPLLEAFRDSPYADFIYTPPLSAPWDKLHANSIMKLEPAIAAKFPMFKAGQLLVSMRNISTLAVLDPDSGKVVWACKGPWIKQHAAQFLPNGHILLFDNQGFIDDGKPYSRIIEFDPATMAIAWSYTGSPNRPFYTASFGRVQRLGNGDTFITDPLESHLFEVTPQGQVVWSYRLPAVYSKIEADMPPYNVQGLAAKLRNPAIKEFYDSRPNLATAIVNAIRYTPEELPFLNHDSQPLHP